MMIPVSYFVVKKIGTIKLDVVADKLSKYGKLISIDVKNGEEGAVKVRLIAPDKNVYIERTVLLNNGKADIRLSVPQNAMIGCWAVEATDFVSGNKGFAAIIINE